jgi:hypothetical protein
MKTMSARAQRSSNKSESSSFQEKKQTRERTTNAERTKAVANPTPIGFPVLELENQNLGDRQLPSGRPLGGEKVYWSIELCLELANQLQCFGCFVAFVTKGSCGVGAGF